MRVLVAHNLYRQAGGEDVVVRAERALLVGAGHEVVTYFRRNRAILLNGFVSRTRLAVETVWARDSHRTLRELIASKKPQVAHFHNTLPLISPSAYYACREAGIPVVQTLHNYRLLCSAATLFRDGHVCEECIEHSLLRGIHYGCYRDSRSATAAVAAMLGTHRLLGTWSEQVDCYIALTEFSRHKFAAAGLPVEKIVVKPNFFHPDPGPRDAAGDYALFVGRLSAEKGLRTLLAGWRRLDQCFPLRVVGDGPLRSEMEGGINGAKEIHFAGRLPREQTLAAIKRARFLVFHSEWYECSPMTLIEALACGVPVIASRLGAMAEIVTDGQTGLHFTAGDADDLAGKVEWAWTHPQEMEAMGRAARAEYEVKYTAARNYQLLMGIYQKAACGDGSRLQ